MAPREYRPILTEAGFNAALTAEESGFKVDISHVAVGDAGRTIVVNDKGRTTTSSLQSERQRVAIQDVRYPGGGQKDISFVLNSVPDDEAGFFVREVGFFLTDGTLFAVASHPDTALLWTGPGETHAIAMELVLDAVDPDIINIISTGPSLNLLMTEEFARLVEGQAQLTTWLIKLTEAFHHEFGRYPTDEVYK